MRKIITILLSGLFLSACMTEDIHSMLKNQEDHEIRIRAFEALCKTINQSNLALQAIVEAAEEGDYLTDIQQTANGYTLTFAHRGTFTLFHGNKGSDGEKGDPGTDGTDGADGNKGTNGTDGIEGVNAPTIGIGEENGTLYWTQALDGVTGWLLAPDGERMKVRGDKGAPGTDGTPGEDGNSPVPVLDIDHEGYWRVDGQRVKDSNGNEVKAKGATGLPGPDGANAPSGIPGTGLFKEVKPLNDSVIFELFTPAGMQFTLPCYEPMLLTLEKTGIIDFTDGATRTLGFTPAGISEIRFITPARWRTKVDMTNRIITITAPLKEEPNRETGGQITVMAFNGKGQTLSVALTVKIQQP